MSKSELMKKLWELREWLGMDMMRSTYHKHFPESMYGPMEETIQEDQDILRQAIRIIREREKIERRHKAELAAIRDEIPIGFLKENDRPGATGPTPDLDLVGAVRMLRERLRDFEACKAGDKD